MIFGYHGMNEVGVKSLLWVRSLIINYYTHKKSPGSNSPPADTEQLSLPLVNTHVFNL